MLQISQLDINSWIPNSKGLSPIPIKEWKISVFAFIADIFFMSDSDWYASWWGLDK